jgi:carbon-monoxide dehydrogenase small subunit
VQWAAAHPAGGGTNATADEVIDGTDTVIEDIPAETAEAEVKA